MELLIVVSVVVVACCIGRYVRWYFHWNDRVIRRRDREPLDTSIVVFVPRVKRGE